MHFHLKFSMMIVLTLQHLMASLSVGLGSNLSNLRFWSIHKICTPLRIASRCRRLDIQTTYQERCNFPEVFWRSHRDRRTRTRQRGLEWFLNAPLPGRLPIIDRFSKKHPVIVPFKSTADVLPIKKQVKTFTPAAIRQVTLWQSGQDAWMWMFLSTWVPYGTYRRTGPLKVSVYHTTAWYGVVYERSTNEHDACLFWHDIGEELEASHEM